MPGGRKNSDSPAKREQRRLLFIQTGQVQEVGQGNWDPKPELFAEAVMSLIELGAAVMFSSTGGGRIIGVKIWEGDSASDRKWLNDNEEVDDWATGIIQLAKRAREGVGE